MLFNAAVIAFAGALLQRSIQPLYLWTLYLFGGAAAQFASVVSYPHLVSSGASQAMLILCGMAVLVCWVRRAPSNSTVAILAIIAIQIGLDLKEAGVIKIGHAVGLTLGLAAGIIVRLRRENRTVLTA